MAAEALKSQSITNADNTPYVPNTAGQGAAGRPAKVADFVSPTASGIGSSGSTYKLVRIPTGAIIQGLSLGTSGALDSNGTPTLAFDIDVVFSDSTDDGTQAALQGLIPTTANTGATTTFTSYSSPNKAFGAALNLGTHWSTQVQLTNITLQGSQTNYPLSSLLTQPLWQTFGFVDGRGNPADPGGYFDIVAYTSTGAATGAAAILYCQCDYVF